MDEEVVLGIITLSLLAGAVIIGMVLMTIRSIVRTNVLASLKKRCIAAGMSAADIERVVLVGEQKGLGRFSTEQPIGHEYPLEKTPPVIANQSYASAR